MKYNLLVMAAALNVSIFLTGMLPSTQTTFFLDSKGLVVNESKYFGQSIFTVLPLDQKDGQLLSLAFADGINLHKQSCFECVVKGKKTKITLIPCVVNHDKHFYSLECVTIN